MIVMMIANTPSLNAFRRSGVMDAVGGRGATAKEFIACKFCLRLDTAYAEQIHGQDPRLNAPHSICERSQSLVSVLPRCLRHAGGLSATNVHPGADTGGARYPRLRGRR